MRWSFRIEHVVGAKNFGPDALSRYPALVGGVSSTAYLGGGFPQDGQHSDDVEEAVIAFFKSGKGVRVVSWDVVRKAGISDPQYAELLHFVGSGSREWSDANKVYERHVEKLSVVDGVVTHGDRIVVPHSLREEVLRALHRAH